MRRVLLAILFLSGLGSFLFLLGEITGQWGSEAVAIYSLLLGVVTAFLFAAWQLSKNDVFFTFVGRGGIRTVDRGESNVIRILANLTDHHVENMKITKDEPKRNLLEKYFGLYWIGIPPATVHEFQFVHERMNPNINENTPVSEWIMRDERPTPTKELLWEIPHSYLVPGVELADGFRVNVLFNTRSQVVDPVIALYVRRGQFIDYMAQYVRNGVIGVLSMYTITEFRNANKDENSDLAKRILATIDPPGDMQGLLEAVGLTVIGGFVSHWDASDKTEAEALAAEKKAELDGKGRVAAAKKDREAAMTLAQGQMAGLDAALEIIKKRTPGIDEATALREANALAIATKMSHPESPVTVLGAGIAIGVD